MVYWKDHFPLLCLCSYVFGFCCWDGIEANQTATDTSGSSSSSSDLSMDGLFSKLSEGLVLLNAHYAKASKVLQAGGLCRDNSGSKFRSNFKDLEDPGFFLVLASCILGVVFSQLHDSSWAEKSHWTWINRYIHIHVHVYIYARTHTYIYIYMYIYIGMASQWFKVIWSMLKTIWWIYLWPWTWFKIYCYKRCRANSISLGSFNSAQ